MAKIILIGTSHRYQTGRAEAEAVEQFRSLLRSLCSEHGTTAIAEEMDTSALTQAGTPESIPGVIAKELKLEHQLSDPSPEIRQQLGISSENDIRSQGFFRGWTKEQIENEVGKSHKIREQYWLDQFRILNSWPLLFVCGANHIETFFALLRSSGLEVVAPVADWEPNRKLPRQVGSL